MHEGKSAFFCIKCMYNAKQLSSSKATHSLTDGTRRNIMTSVNKTEKTRKESKRTELKTTNMVPILNHVNIQTKTKSFFAGCFCKSEAKKAGLENVVLKK